MDLIQPYQFRLRNKYTNETNNATVNTVSEQIILTKNIC
jgi:hypothetical protein